MSIVVLKLPDGSRTLYALWKRLPGRRSLLARIPVVTEFLISSRVIRKPICLTSR